MHYKLELHTHACMHIYISFIKNKIGGITIVLSNIYICRLRDEDVNVRRTCVRMLSNLIMREMIRVKGQVSELALCIIDEDKQIQQDTKEFFNQLAQKGNALYNIVPDILSRLADPQLNLDEKRFQETIR